MDKVVSPYVQMGIVSIVYWPYNNCVNNMASGRYVYYKEYTADKRKKVAIVVSNDI